MPLSWYVTPLHKPDKLIAGPYASKEQCDRECIKALSLETKLQSARTVSMPVLYFISRPLSQARQPMHTTLPIIQATPRVPPYSLHKQSKQSHTGQTRADAPTVATQAVDPLARMHNLPLHKLKFMALSLEISYAENTSKQEIISKIRLELGL